MVPAHILQAFYSGEDNSTHLGRETECGDVDSPKRSEFDFISVIVTASKGHLSWSNRAVVHLFAFLELQ